MGTGRGVGERKRWQGIGCDEGERAEGRKSNNRQYGVGQKWRVAMWLSWLSW